MSKAVDVAVQVRDAQAAQLSAEQTASTFRAELTQLSRHLAAAQEMGSMWQGRAEGLQQELDQATAWQVRVYSCVTAKQENTFTPATKS